MKLFSLKGDRRGAAALFGAALLAALSLGGCATTGIEATGKKTWDQEGAPGLSRKVVINNSSLARSIRVVDLKSALAGNLMRAQVSLRSRQSGTLPVQYRFEWFDGQGMEIGSDPAWNPLIIYGDESRTVVGVAPDPRAQEFKLKLRAAD